MTEKPVMSMVHCFNSQEMFTNISLKRERIKRHKALMSAYSLFFQLSLGDSNCCFSLLSMAFLLFVCWVLMTHGYALSFLNTLNLCIHIQTTVLPFIAHILVPTPDLSCLSVFQPVFFAMSVTDK